MDYLEHEAEWLKAIYKSYLNGTMTSGMAATTEWLTGTTGARTSYSPPSQPIVSIGARDLLAHVIDELSHPNDESGDPRSVREISETIVSRALGGSWSKPLDPIRREDWAP